MSREAKLESYLSGESQLSRIYRTGKRELPPESLDKVIVAAARQNMEHISNPPRAISVACTLPISLAAAVFLGASLVLFVHMSREADMQSRTIPRVAVPGAVPSAVTQATAPIARVSEGPELEEPDQPGNVELSSLREHSRAKITNADLQTQSPEGKFPDEDTELARRLSLPEPEWTVELMEDPKAWLDYIELLVLKNRVSEAGTQLRAFAERHPKVKLPETLLVITTDAPGTD